MSGQRTFMHSLYTHPPTHPSPPHTHAHTTHARTRVISERATTRAMLMQRNGELTLLLLVMHLVCLPLIQFKFRTVANNITLYQIVRQDGTA